MSKATQKKRFLFDMGHPGHVHLFRNLIRLLESRGHEVFVTARDKEVTQQLLRAYGIPFFNRGKGFKGVIGKILGTISITATIITQARRSRPDILVGGVGNVYIALAAFFLKKPSFICDDTEHASLELSVVRRFATYILTPDSYLADLGPKQVRYAGYHEWAYLHPGYFTPDPSLMPQAREGEPEKYVVVRFVSWSAGHDVGKKGLNTHEQIGLVDSLSRHARIYISAEGELPSALEPFRLRTPPEHMHHIIAGAALFIGEGATMASESVCLGVPAIYANPLIVGYCSEQARHGLLFHETESEAIVGKAVAVLGDDAWLTEYRERRRRLFEGKTDVTAFFYRVMTEYPSFKMEHQNRNNNSSAKP